MVEINKILNEHIPFYWAKLKNNAVEWSGRAVVHFKQLPGHMHNNIRVAGGVFVVANLIFFIVVNKIIKKFESKLNKDENLTRAHRFFKYSITNLTGASLIYGLNFGLATLTNYPVSKIVLSSTSIGFIFVRVISKALRPNPIKPDTTKPTPPPQSKPPENPKPKNTNSTESLEDVLKKLTEQRLKKKAEEEAAKTNNI